MDDLHHTCAARRRPSFVPERDDWVDSCGTQGGNNATRRVVQRAPDVRVVALTASMDEARMFGVLRAGATGYVRKDADPEVLLAAVRAVAAGKTYIDPAVGRQIVSAAAPNDDLTPREVDVLRQLALARSNKEIASALSISAETVKTHVGHVLSKLQVENRAQAIVHALKRGIVSLEELEQESFPGRHPRSS